MTRILPAIACLLILAGASQLRSQDARDFILAARRSGVVELIDPATLETAGRIHFDFNVERLSSSADGSKLYVDGYSENSCCKQYALDLSTLKLEEAESIAGSLSQPWEYFGNSQISPDGRWRFEMRSFRGPALKTFDLATGTVQELIPSALPLSEQNCGGNWSAQGVWSGDRFYFYVRCPAHPGFMWTILPGDMQLGVVTAVAPFGEVPGCRQRLPLERALVAAEGKLFLYEEFGGKGDRTRMCRAPLPGGAWMVDTETGRLTRQIAAGFHFNRLIPNRSESMLFGVDPGAGWGAVQLVVLDGQNYEVINSRNFGPGPLQIAIGPLRQIPAGDVWVSLTGTDR